MAMSRVLASRRATRPCLPRLQALQVRGLAAQFTDGEKYWRDTPWRDTSVEEFNTYRWQACEVCYFSGLANLLSFATLS